MIILDYIFLILFFILAIPVSIFVSQIVVSLPAYKNKDISIVKRSTVTVLIPAHNESKGLLPTLECLKKQMHPEDKIIVIADNCSDDTAQIAKTAGAEVLERFDDTNKGKGYALDFGIRYLKNQAVQPEILIIVDADCLLSSGGIERLAVEALTRNCPIQALYSMGSPEGAGLKTKIAEFAYVVKCHARPLGFMRLGFPCQLGGTGMAFPWQLMQMVDIASGAIVEDIKLGLDFAALNFAPQFCPEVTVSSVFPLNNDGVNSQRTRWEHGHLGMILKTGPKLIWNSIKLRNLNMLALALDVCVPPLALLTLLVFCLGLVAFVGIMISQVLFPWLYVFLLIIAFGVAILLAWAKYGRDIVSFTSLLFVPVYIFAKLPLYFKFIVKRQEEWVRAKRD